MGTPELTHPQFAIIACIGNGRVKGPDLRTALKSQFDIQKEGPAFYMMMDRMEKAGFIESETIDLDIGGKIYKQKTYWVKGKGQKAFLAAQEFYSTPVEGWNPQPATG